MPEERTRSIAIVQRLHTLDEVHLGISKRDALENARIFLERESSAKGAGCPLGTSHFDVLRLVAKRDFGMAYIKLLETNPLPGVTGRLCAEPFELTQVYNRKGERISLRAIERFLSDHVHTIAPIEKKPQNKLKVAVVGSGLAGLSVASFLARSGYAVTVLESSHVLGGSLAYAYGEFLLPSKVVSGVVARLRAQGVDFQVNVLVGKGVLLEELVGEKDYAAVVLACGVASPLPLGIPGENAAGVLGADEMMKLTVWMKSGDKRYSTPDPLGARVLVVGKTPLAFAAARMARRLGREVTLVIRGSESEMSVAPLIVREAAEEGVRFKTYADPVRVNTDISGCVKGLVCSALDYSVDAMGQQVVVREPDSEFVLEADTIINASEQTPSTVFFRNSVLGLCDKNGRVALQENRTATHVRQVFAAGHCIDPQMDILDVILSAKKAADEVLAVLRS